MKSNSSEQSVSILPFLISFTVLLLTALPRVARSIEPDIPRIQAGAEKGSIQQEIELGADYLAGHGVARDEKQAAHWYEKAANSGDPSAQMEIGFFYQAGVGVQRDPARAVKWFERAVAGGLVSAKVNLGVAYLWGLGVQKDPAFAEQLFRDAAKKGNGTGACYLGDMYYFGISVPKDISQATHWLELGSKLHSPMAEYNLALVISSRPGKANSARAVSLLREAGAAGYVPAKHQLGLMIVREPALAASSGEAVSLLEEASSEGSWKSSVLLGILARDGKGIAQDHKAAYYRFRIAVLQGGPSAAAMLKGDIQKLSSELGDTQTKELDLQGSAWVQTHNRRLQFVNLQGDDSKHFPAFALEFPGTDTHAGQLIGAPDPEMGPVAENSFHP